MTFNIPKCKIIQFTTHRYKTKHLYTMSETPLEVVEEHGPTDLGVKNGKNSEGKFYVTTSLSDSWEAFTPLHAGVTLGRFLH